MIVLSGGEPTIRKDLIEIADFVRNQQLSLGLVTNGLMLAYPKLVDDLIGRGLSYVYTSLCGPDQELHDQHIRNQGFKQSLKALANLAGKIEDLTINVVMTAKNYQRLHEFVDLAQSFQPLRLKFSMLEPEGAVLDDFDSLVPPLAKVAAEVSKLLEDDDSNVPMVFDGLPLCLLDSKLWPKDCSFREDDILFISEPFQDEWYPTDNRNRTFGAACLDCSQRRRCRGVYRQYLRQRGDFELRPLSQNISNSFNFEVSSKEEPFDPGDCLIQKGKVFPPDPIREIAVQNTSTSAIRYYAITNDFSNETISDSIRELGQVYWAKSEKLLLDDFSQDLRKLSLAAICRDCPKRSLCGGFWQKTNQAGFEKANQILKASLSKIQGRILDIGCGQTPYLKNIAADLDYVGIDPERPDEQISSNQRIIQASLDSFDWDGSLFDSIISIRSLGHLTSVRAGMNKITKMSAPQAKLLLAEDTVFGLVRDEKVLEQIRKEDDLPFEHYSCISAAEAVLLAKEQGWQLVEEYTPLDTQSTLWICLFEKN
jgi:MoaA/NifB/PqqE/SkfB family radical SAM enzyme